MATMAEVNDVVDLLVEDHRRLDGILERLDRGQDPTELRSLYLQVVGELASHEACEQQVVFPALRASVPAAGTDMIACLDEHDEINSLLDEMRGLDPSCYGFMKRTSALILELRAHFAEEEELFGRLRAALDPAELADLARRAQAAKSRAPAFPAARTAATSGS
jgi:hemerythrin HHE cation binding domain-containing protein